MYRCRYIFSLFIYSSILFTQHLISLSDTIPQIASFSPASGFVGSTVTITGKNFSMVTGENIVRFGGMKAIVTQADSNSLIVTLPLGAIYAPIAVTVRSLTCYSTASFLPTYSGGDTISSNSFLAKNDFPTQSSPSSVALADLNGNGAIYVIVSNYGGDISIYRNTSSLGNINLAQPINIHVGSGSHQVVAADIDGDGKLDLLITNRLNHNFSILHNINTSDTISSASFAPKVDFVTGNLPSSISIGDIDSDGKPDVVIANSGTNTVSVYKNISTQDSIKLLSKVDFQVGNEPYYAVIKDINADGKPDIAATNSSSNTISILRNKSINNSISNVSFAQKIDINTGSYPIGIAVNDVNSDGKPDLIVNNQVGNTISIFKNVSTTPETIAVSSFSSKIDFVTGTNPWYVAMGDINGDSKPDIITTNWNGSSISVFENVSSSGLMLLLPKIDFTAGDGTRGAVIGDLNGDGKADLAVTNWVTNKLSIYKNICTSGIPSAPLNLTAIAGDGQTILKWNKNKENDFLRYFIYRGLKADSLNLVDSTLGGIDDTTKTLTGLTNNTNYYFSITAVDSERNESAFSDLVSVIPNDGIAPAVPQNLLITDSTNYSIKLAWSKNGELDFLRYRIYGGTSINPTVKIDSTTGGINDTSKTIFGLTAGTTYYFRVTAVDSGRNESIFSNLVYGIPNEGIAPAAPQHLTVIDSSNYKIKLVWRKNTEPDFLRYRIYGGTSVNPTVKIDSTTGGISDTSKTIFGLIGGVKYYFRVTAVDSFSNESEFSNMASATPDFGLNVDKYKSQIPKTYIIDQNYPNPFNPTTMIRFGLPERSNVKLDIYNLLGQKIATLIDGQQDAKYYEVQWNAKVSSGIYFYRIQASSLIDPSKSFVRIRSMILLK